MRIDFLQRIAHTLTPSPPIGMMLLENFREPRSTSGYPVR